MQLTNKFGKPSLFTMCFTSFTCEWFAAAMVGASVVSGFLGAKAQGKANQENLNYQREQSKLNSADVNKWNTINLGVSQANTATQRADAIYQSQYQIEQNQKRYDAWTEEFGDIQDQVTDYYKNMSKETVAGAAYNQLQGEYQKVMTDVQNSLSQRGITPQSGFYTAAELNLNMQKATQSAKIDQESEKYVMDTKQQFIQDQANNPFLEGTRPDEFNPGTQSDVIMQGMGQNQKDIYSNLQQDYANNKLSAKDFQTKMLEMGGSQGAKLFDTQGVGGADVQAQRDCAGKNRSAAPGVEGVSTQFVNGQCVETKIPALPQPKPVDDGMMASGMNSGGSGEI